MKPIVIINGSGGCGKSTFIKLCKEGVQEAIEKKISKQSPIKFQCEVEELSSVDFVKDIATECGWDGQKTEKNRAFLSDLKTILSDWDNVPNKKVMESIKQYNDDVSWIFFVNIREKKEIENFIKLCEEEGYDCTTLLIKNDRVPVITSNKSDAYTEDYHYDNTIYNNFGLDFYKKQAYFFIRDIVGKMIEIITSNLVTTTTTSIPCDFYNKEKEFNCPDCNHTDNTCYNCMRFQSVFNSNKEDSIKKEHLINKKLDLNKTPNIYFDENYKQVSLFDITPLPCRNCSNYPINGGSGICHCTLGDQVFF